MQPIAFRAPSSVSEACELLDELGDDAIIISGGQSLIQMLKQRLVNADTVIHIGEIPELHGIRQEGDTIWIGATTTYEEVRHHDLVAEAVPLLPEAIATIGDKQVRSKGTLVGGIAHADPSGDPPVTAVALDATIRLDSVDGSREVAGTDFYEGLFETKRDHNELITEVGFPVLDDSVTTAYRSFAPRQGDYAFAAIATVLEREENGQISAATVTAGCVADTPVRLSDVESVLVGESLTDDLIEEAAALARETVPAIEDEEASAHYRRSLIETLCSDVLRSSLSA